MSRIRVLVFGATGIGKTSLCNELTGKSRPVGNNARGVTAKAHIYAPFNHDGNQIEVIDTVGLHESIDGTVPADQAAMALIELLESARDGFSLLIQVSRAARITKDHDQDYELFVKQLGQQAIPTVLVLTGCENEQPMSQWVDSNTASFAKYEYAQIIGTCFAKGGALESHYAPLRAESTELVLAAITAHATKDPVLVYGDSTDSTFADTLARVWNAAVEILGLPANYRKRANESAYGLLKRVGVPQSIAEKMVKHIPDLLEEIGNKAPVPMLGKVLKKASTLALKSILKPPSDK